METETTQSTELQIIKPRSDAVVNTFQIIRAWQDEDNLPALTKANIEDVLFSFGDAFMLLNAAETNSRMAFGNLLRETQRKKLWEPFADTWDEFISTYLVTRYHLGTRTIKKAMEIAGCEALKAIPEAQRGRMTLGGAEAVAKVERANGKASASGKGEVPQETIDLAISGASGPEVLESAGHEAGTRYSIWAAHKKSIKPIQLIHGWLGGVSPDAARKLAAVTTSPEIIALTGGGPDNIADFVSATVEQEIQNKSEGGHG